jgi:hypothetical protein
VQLPDPAEQVGRGDQIVEGVLGGVSRHGSAILLEHVFEYKPLRRSPVSPSQVSPADSGSETDRVFYRDTLAWARATGNQELMTCPGFSEDLVVSSTRCWSRCTF